VKPVANSAPMSRNPGGVELILQIENTLLISI